MLSVPQNRTADALLITHFDDVEAFFWVPDTVFAKFAPGASRLELSLERSQRSRAISSDLERIADYATNVAKRGLQLAHVLVTVAVARSNTERLRN